ncbi:MAG: type II secretion system F family protein [Sedimentisphaerales bacterium]|nr:type II secretion system F family protein [Sedimentisphaerales bacterium]
MFNFTAIVVVLFFIYVILGYKKPGVALITVPFVAFAVGFAAATMQTEEKILYAPLLFIVVQIVIAVSTHKRESLAWCHQFATWTLLAVALVLLLSAVLIVCVLLEAGPVVPLLFFVGTAVIVGGIVGYNLTARRVSEAQVFSVLGSSIRQNLPLPMALDCAAAGQADAVGRLLRRIKTWLVKGYPLEEAVRRGYPQCRRWALAMLAAGQRVHQLPAAVQAVETEMRMRTYERQRVRPVHPFYPVVVFTAMIFLTGGYVTFVLPQFVAVWEEMVTGELLPRSTRALIWITQGVSRILSSEILVPLLIVLLVLFWIVIGLRRVRRARGRLTPSIFSRLIDSLRWYLPIFHWFEKNRSTLRVVELLRMSLRAGCPVNEAIRGALDLDVNHCFRKRLGRWLERVERGDDIAASARACGLGSALAWAFDNKDSGVGTPAVLDMLQSYYRSNYSYRVNLARFILWPCGIILLGLAVGFVVHASFTPGVVVLEIMTGAIYP